MFLGSNYLNQKIKTIVGRYFHTSAPTEQRQTKQAAGERTTLWSAKARVEEAVGAEVVVLE